MPPRPPAGISVRDLLDQVDPEGGLAPCGIQQVLLGSGVIATVPETVQALLAADQRSGTDGRPGRPRVVLLVDATRIERNGQDVKDLVESLLGERFQVRRTVLDDGHPTLHVTDAVVEHATAATTGADAVVALGGGTISDIGKLSARGTTAGGRPALVTVQTAASVDGFTNDMSVLLRDGVKRTVASRWPDAVIADAETVAGAPKRMSRAGYGEMTSMLVSPADWRLAQLIGIDETYDDRVIRILDAVGSSRHEWSGGVGNGDPDAIAALTWALAVRGVAGGVAGTTAALSGVEHLVSHMLDQHHGAQHLPMGLHGAQVGVASVVAAAAWELLVERLAHGSAALDDSALDLDRARDRVEGAFAPLDPSGGIAEECWRDYSAKLVDLTRLRPGVAALLDSWPLHELDLLRLARPSADIASGLRAAGAATTFAELDPVVPDELARWAVENCGLMRRRFTVVDLLTLLGWWSEKDVDEVFARAAASVASREEG
jgi:glycerol-1-phosphate dehydrogenase [NAD(P)+]